MARWHGGSVAYTACTAASQQEGHGFESRMALEGKSSPDLQCSGGLSPRPFCVEFACSPRVHKEFPPLRTPTEKTCKKNRTLSCPSLTKMDGSLHLVPGRLKAAPAGSWRKDSPGWENAENKLTATWPVLTVNCETVIMQYLGYSIVSLGLITRIIRSHQYFKPNPEYSFWCGGGVYLSNIVPVRVE